MLQPIFSELALIFQPCLQSKNGPETLIHTSERGCVVKTSAYLSCVCKS